MKALFERIYPPALSTTLLPVSLVAVMMVQGMVLIGMYALSALPVITGSDVLLRTVPVDPRSLFRGNYARLGYDISRIDAAEFATHQLAEELHDSYPAAQLRTGEVVYVRLRRGEDGMYEFAGAQLTRPERGIFIRGRVRDFWAAEQPQYRVEYGIEAFFASKKTALELERQLAGGGVAVLKVSKSGRARVVDVVPAEWP